MHTVLCHSCGRENKEGSVFCSACGTHLEAQPEKVACSACGRKNRPGSLFCAACGTTLAEKQPAFCSRCGAAMAPEQPVCQICGHIRRTAVNPADFSPVLPAEEQTSPPPPFPIAYAILGWAGILVAYTAMCFLI